MDDRKSAFHKLGRVSAFGLTAGVTMVVCGAAGVWIDGRLGSTPVFTAILFLAGGASALWYGIVRILK